MGRAPFYLCKIKRGRVSPERLTQKTFYQQSTMILFQGQRVFPLGHNIHISHSPWVECTPSQAEGAPDSSQ